MQPPEDLHGGFSVGVVGWLEAQLLQAQPVKEHLQSANQVAQRQALVTYHTCTCRHQLLQLMHSAVRFNSMQALCCHNTFQHLS